MAYRQTDLARIFQPFERGAVRSSEESPRIGLWMTSQIVQTHGGMVLVHSEVRRVPRLLFASDEQGKQERWSPGGDVFTSGRVVVKPVNRFYALRIFKNEEALRSAYADHKIVCESRHYAAIRRLRTLTLIFLQSVTAVSGIAAPNHKTSICPSSAWTR